MYSEREQELLNTLTDVCNANGIKLCLQPPSLAFLDNPVAVDVEHDENGNFVCVGVCHGNQVDVFTEITPILKEGLQQAQIIAHNGLSDLELLRQWGVDVKNEQLIWDTMLCAHIMDSSRAGYGLKQLAKEELGTEYPSYTDIVGKKTAKQKIPRRTLDKWPVEIVSKYNALDTYCTYKLWERQTCTQPKNILSR